MTIFIFNSKGEPVSFTISTFFQGQFVNTTNSDGVNPSIEISTAGYPLSDFGVKIESEGYKTISTTLDKLTDTTIFLQKASLPYIQIIAAVALFAYAAKHRKKVGEITENDLRLIALGFGGLLAFDTLRKVLEGLGLWKSRDTKDLDNAATDPNSFWSPNYYLSLAAKGTQWTTGITATTADQWLKDIDNAFSFWGDNESTVIGILKRCRTQATLSFLAWEYNHNTGGDFLSYLRGKEKWYPWGGLSDADVNEVSQYISRLPKY